MAQKTMIQVVTDALALELEKDESVLVFSKDVGDNGGVLRATEGLQEEFDEDRIFNTPLAESGIDRSVFDLVLQGYHPAPKVQFFSFIFEVFDEIINQMARTRYRMSEARNMPIIIRAPPGGGVHTPELHSDNLEGLIAQSSGVRVVVPSNPYDARGLLVSSIRGGNPIAYLEHMKLYRSFREEVPDETYEVSLDKAAVAHGGTDVSITTYGATVYEAIKAADDLAGDNTSAEIIGLHIVTPLDVKTIINSVEKAGRMVVVQGAQKQTSASAIVTSEISERTVLLLEAPIGRVSVPDTVPSPGQTKNIQLPDARDTKARAREIVEF